MKKVSKTSGLLLALQMILSIGAGASASEATSAQFLKLGAGARAAGMADAFSSVADDVTAAYWNPAGLARMESSEISLMQNNQLLDTKYQYAGGAMPFKNHVLALSLYRMDYGSIDRYTAADVRDGNFNAGSLAGSFSVGKKIKENLDFGFSVKFIQESIESEKATGFAGDAGFILHQGAYNFGATIQHVGPGLKFVQEKGSLPQTIRAGVSRTFSDHNLLVAFDLSKPKDNDTTYHGGMEYRVNQVLTLRGGYQATPGNSLDVGGLVGVTGGIGIHIHQFSIDYGFVPFGDLGATHRISLLLHFDKK